MKKLVVSIGFVVAGTIAGLVVNGCGTDSSSSSSSTSSYAGPGSHYTFSFSGSDFTIKKYANKSATSADFTVNGTSSTLSTGFKLLTVSSVSGTGGPSVGDKAYALEVSGVALFVKPLATASPDQLLAAVAAGSCPTSTMNANWMIVKKGASDDMTDANKDIYGTFTFNPTTGVASLPTKYSLQNTGTNLGAQSFAAASCSNGNMQVTAGGDTAQMYLTQAGAALINTQESSEANANFIFGLPSATLTASTLAGDYAGLLFSGGEASGSRLSPITMTITAPTASTLSGTGTKYSNVETGATSAGNATFAITAVNSPSAGLMIGTITAGGNTSNVACVGAENVNSTGKNIISCSGRDPGSNTTLFNLILIKK